MNTEAQTLNALVNEYKKERQDLMKNEIQYAKKSTMRTMMVSPLTNIIRSWKINVTSIVKYLMFLSIQCPKRIRSTKSLQ